MTGTDAAADFSELPQLLGGGFVTDGGIETDLIHHHGVDLPHFAAFPLLEDRAGQALLGRYYGEYAAIARRAGVGLLLESPTWRANTDWGERLGYSASSLTKANVAAIALLHRLRAEHEESLSRVVVGGVIGPRELGYSSGPRIDPDRIDPDEAAAYHRPQVRAFVDAGAELVTAHTLSDVGEAKGVVRAARDEGLPVAIAFTVEVDGRLAGGATLAEAVEEVDAEDRPEYYLVNCAHPTHIELALSSPGAWRERVVGLLSNASTQSHAELDEATELDEGDPRALAAAHARLEPLLPHLSVVGGCCGTDSRHVAALWGVG